MTEKLTQKQKDKIAKNLENVKKYAAKQKSKDTKK